MCEDEKKKNLSQIMTMLTFELMFKQNLVLGNDTERVFSPVNKNQLSLTFSSENSNSSNDILPKNHPNIHSQMTISLC